MRLIANKTGSEAVLHFTANDSVIIAGNNSVSNVATSNETVNSAYITQIFYGSPSATAFWTVKRGANTVAVLDSTGHLDLAGNGTALKLDTTDTLDVTLTGGTEGFLIVEVQKNSDIIQNDYLVG
jgi:hypothetical protein